MRRLCLAPILLLLAAAPAPPQAHPALWKLSDRDTVIWLFGTVHALPAGYRWRDAAIDAAIAQAGDLTLEIVIDQQPEQIATLLATMGRGAGLPPLRDRVPAAKRARLAQLIAASGASPALLDGMKSWAAGIILSGAAMREIGVGAGDGVEAELSQAFRRKGEPIDGLESAQQQLGFFDSLPEPAQRGFLVATLDSPAAARKEFSGMVAAWSKGDVAAIARAFAEDPEFTPVLRDRLVRQRNRAWADLLAARLARPGRHFVAVGAGHLAGPDSLIAMLRARGLTVARAD